MKILYLTNHLNIGGITSYLLTLSRGLSARGHRIYLAASSAGVFSEVIKPSIAKGTTLPSQPIVSEKVSKFISSIGSTGLNKAGEVNFIAIPLKTKCEFSPQILLCLRRLLPVVRAEEIELIHANTRVTQVLAYLIHRYSGRSYLCTCHGFFKRRLSRLLFPCWGKKVIAISAEVKEHLMNDFAVAGDKIAVINHGIDLERFRPQPLQLRLKAKEGLGLGTSLVAGIIARLSDVKGHRYLIEAMREVAREFPQARLLIVGEGREKEELTALSERLGISERVIFVASASDTLPLLAAMDIFVMPSLKEGLGLGLMEAMASGLAVIGSDTGGIKTLIRDGYNGLLVRAADSGGLAAAIIGLFKDAGKRDYLGQNARDFIKRDFSQERMCQETERIYAQCLGEG